MLIIWYTLVNQTWFQTRLQAIQSTVDRTANAGPLETIMEDEEFSTAKSKGKTLLTCTNILHIIHRLYINYIHITQTF